MTHRILYLLACLILPVAWGVAVDRVFRRIERSRGRRGNRPTPPPPEAPATPSGAPVSFPPEYYI